MPLPRTVALAAALALLSVAPARAQLRPLDPAEWRVWEGRTLVAGAGGGAFTRQRASLAGTEGRLLEAGNFSFSWRTGRVALEGGGTVQRFFRVEERFAAPHGGARPVESGGLHDAGDYRIATVVRLTPENAGALAVLRFGTRLPTTDNRVGLDRDQTDFFAMLGGRMGRGALRVSAETGVSINGTRDPGFEQSDVWVYLLRVERAGALTPSLTLTGHEDGLPRRTIRGNEDLGEVRLGLRAGRRRWVEAALVKGYTPFSPGVGVIVQAGVER